MASVLKVLPELQGEELNFIQSLVKKMDDEQAQQFAQIYRARRKNPQEILIFTIIGFLGIAGIQRIILNQIGMGILYFFTLGLCYIGTIIDLINYQKLTFEYNHKIALEVKAAVA
ncbi:MAG: TM2 domain-containing protein [Fulvivirga sp.]|nr:TM2 domain-containing protein [Fulvivirga sp.]